MFSLRSTALRVALIPWLILLLFLAQGLRLCIPVDHAHEDHDHGGVHLESVITSAADQHESKSHDGDVDLQLSALLKVFKTHPLVLALFSFFLLVLLRPSTSSDLRAYALAFRPSRGHRFSPPLRAPPR